MLTLFFQNQLILFEMLLNSPIFQIDETFYASKSIILVDINTNHSNNKMVFVTSLIKYPIHV